EVLVMNGNGGMVSSHYVAREAAKTVMSGPASGVKAAAYTGSRAGFRNLLTYDMGGTSSDVALILDAEPAVSNEIEIEYAMPIHVPMVDVRTVGAGGGSIAKINPGGLLEVGPESAGANPGPICYGNGGTKPTISDANLLLGRLNPEKFASLQSSSSIEMVEELFERELGAPLGINAVGAAEAVV
ncbi:MAG: hydantoinase/oxoprolinase family protein, partial [Pseudomonadota bacterium]|nr:hydantoinase/oxoprolinase family protein [Pseudomonadota bacterium]